MRLDGGGGVELLASVAAVLLFVPTSAEVTEFEKALPAKIVWAVPGMDVELPCDITPPVPTDAVNMVFWFKDTIGIPLYSWDARRGPLADVPSHLAMTNDLGVRSYFVTDGEPSKAHLRIERINREDEGVFRCRVDFINSPTRNFKVNLSLVVQPSVPKVFDAEGNEVISVVGPVLEGESLFLSCEVNGEARFSGNPRPTLTWWFNDTIIDGVVDSPKGALTTVNQLQIAAVSRSYFGARLQCRAKSLDIASDVVREVPLIVYLKPNKVKIVTPNELLSSHKSHLLRCETSGSYPPARITWLLDGKSINANTTVEEEKPFTASILSLNVRTEDDGKELVCRAENKRFPGGHVEDRRQIHVAYPPKVSVKPAKDGATYPAKEGSEVKLKCDYSARPDPESFRWYHNGHLLPVNESGGVLPKDDVLILRDLSWKSEGQYSCSALNSEGETYSAPYELNVQYAPRCKKGHETTRVATLENVTLILKCYVDSVPKVTRFHWTYNTSKGVSPVKATKMQNDGDVSTLYFTPEVADLESLSCWATNNVGRQDSPCLFYVVPAKEPDPPRNCALRNATHGEGLEVVCMAGRDGGLEQTFVLEVNDNSASAVQTLSASTTLSDEGEHAVPVYRVLGETPQFRLHSLLPGKEYDLIIYAVNAKGRSDPPVVIAKVKVEGEENSAEEKDTPTEEEEDERNPHQSQTDSIFSGQNLTVILIALTSSVVLLIVGIIIVAAALACRKQRTPVVVMRRPKRAAQDEEDGFGEVFQRRSAQYRASMYAQELERDSGAYTAGR